MTELPINLRGPLGERPGRQFATTRWSVVHAAAVDPATTGRAALETLCQAYWDPLYLFLRRQGCGVEEAQDLTQAFIVFLLEKQTLAAADPERGRFRTFLLSALQNFLIDHQRHAAAAKRAGDRWHLSLDFGTAEAKYQLEPTHALTPERLFQRRWALNLLEQVHQQLASEYASQDKQRLLDVLGKYLGGPAPESYAELGAQLRMSPGAVKVAAHRLKQRYRQILRQTIADTLAFPAEIDDEIRDLFRILSTV